MTRILSMIFTVAICLSVMAPSTAQQPAKDILYTPASSVRIAAADLATIDPEERPYIRYLSLYNVPKEARRQVGISVSFVVNSLSTRRKIYIPVFVGGSDETLIRLNIDQYEWDAKVFDDLARNGSGPRAQAEPYFHALIDKLVVSTTVKNKTFKDVTRIKKTLIGYYQNTGQPAYKEETVTEQVEVVIDVPGKTVRKKVLAGAPWVDPEALAFLIRETQAESPILRADWFIVNATLAPAYYDFLRLGKSLKDFENLIFADQVLAAKARSQDKAVVVTSVVARNNRTLTRSPTFTNGYYWQSHDSLSSIDDRQYILNFLNEKFDATEDIGTLPNGLQAYFLTDGAGNRLDAANIDIALDNTAADRVVRTARSCIICHAEGIKPIQDEVRALTKKLQNREQVALIVTNRKDAFKIEDLFGSNLDEQIIKDQNIYSEAVAATTGLRMDVNAKLFANIYDQYVEVLVSKEVIARDLGIYIEDVDNIIRLSNDPVVLALIRFPPGPVRRDQWERSFQSVMLVALARRQGFVPVQPSPFVPFVPFRK